MKASVYNGKKTLIQIKFNDAIASMTIKIDPV